MTSSFWNPVWLSVQVSAVAGVVVFALGAAAAWTMTGRTFRGKTLLETLLMLPLVLPPTVVGLLLLFLLGRRSWTGLLLDRLFGQPLIFTWWAAVAAAVTVAFPLVYLTLKTGFASVDNDLRDAARSMGATEWQMFRLIIVPLSARFLWSAYVLGFARGLGEFGATIMIAGNIPGKTQTIPTAVYMAVDNGRWTSAWLWSGTMVLLSFLLLAVSQHKTKNVP